MTNGVISEELDWFWKRNITSSKIKQRKTEMRSSLKLLGVKDITFQNIPTRTLKDNIYKTYSKIKEITNLKKIDTIFCPAYEGGHQDHDVSNFICSKFINKYKVYEFPEYNYFHRRINCNTFINSKNTDTVINLISEEKNSKKNCLKVYRSEKYNLDFIRFDNEKFRLLAKYDYLRPPHEGVLFLQEIQLI